MSHFVKSITSTNINLTAPELYIASGNAGNTYDIGISGEYVNSGTKYTGLVKAADDKWYFYKEATAKLSVTEAFDATLATLDDAVAASFQGGNVKINANAITALNENGGITLTPNGTGEVKLAAHISGSSDAYAVADKAYVDSVASGLDPKQSCRINTTKSLLDAVGTDAKLASYAAGVITSDTKESINDHKTYFDGCETLALNERVLVSLEATLGASARYNGIYYVSALGAAGTANWTLTRAADFDTTAEVTPGAFTFIEEGTLYQSTGWVLKGPAPLTLDTSDLLFVQFSSAGAVTIVNAGTGSGLVSNTGASYSVKSFLSTNTGSTGVLGITANANDLTLTLDTGNITTLGAVTSGSIASGFGTISTGNTITTTSTITGATLQTTTDKMDMATSVLTFKGLTTANKIVCPDALADALNIGDGTLSYITLCTDASNKISLPQGVLAFDSGTTAVNKIQLVTALADGLTIGIGDAAGTNSMLTFDTTTPKLIVGKNLDCGANNITTTGQVTAATLATTSDLLKMSTSVLTYAGTTGNNKLSIPDALASGLVVQDASNNPYITITSSATAASRKTKIHNSLEVGDATGDVFLNSGMRFGVGNVTAAEAELTKTYRFVTVDTTSNAVELSLPSYASDGGRSYKIIFKTKGGANNVTIAPQTGEKIDGEVDATITLTAVGDRCCLETDGNSWYVF